MNIALVIIDMQNDFVLPEAPLCVKGAQATVPTRAITPHKSPAQIRLMPIPPPAGASTP